MKRYCLKLLCFLFLFIGAISISLQRSYAENLGINIAYGTPGLFTHNIPLDLSLTTDTSYTGVTVEWVVPYGLSTIPGEKTKYTTPISASSVLYDHLVVTPQAQGTYVVNVTVSGINTDGTPFTKVGTITLHVDNNLMLADTMNEYTIRRIIFYILAAVCFVSFVILMKDVYNNLRERFTNWLNKES